MVDKQKPEQTNALDKILPAVLAVQSKATHVQKGTDNPFFKSKYADLSDIWGAIKDLMAENNLIVTHSMSQNEAKEYLTTRIYHVSGQYLESVCPINPVKNDPQAYGSAVTYMRRYSLSALLGIVTDLDDDGNDASGRTSEQKPQVKKQEPKPQQQKILPMTMSEFTDLCERIKSATNEDELKAQWLLAYAARVRMTDDDFTAITKIKDDKKESLQK